MKILKIISKSMTFLLFLLMISVAMLSIISHASGGKPTVLGHQLNVVLSGSMEPAFHTGSIIAVKQVEGNGTGFQAGDVITFLKEDNTLVTHRIVEVLQNGDHVQYVTKGDNNDAADLEPVLAANVVGEYTGFTVPYLGYILTFATTKEGTALLMIVPGVLLILYSIITLWRVIGTLEKRQEQKQVDQSTS
ncbi:signal peptidase I SipW [Halalkalibacterium halodurans]|uniref:signal peptidase I SipW n=1 Tax=Halalkalibacterium halodurans TaxID=86665 RepID=UPI002AA9C8CD|nr:signal peptidase I [Halalkalibacterium halodurans]MDY7222689.1 signal peptidase I [Halalkalibacterium halodurans]MDY7241910.1 signal peptidase I [Halalkalibacterium halodurans]